ncbi:RagB/SusD family nutrient uptake outer membrane protein [Flavobacterium cerinum]|uniref:RagB/SusD family nutrient uptake outer membrane protein n=1 Tax=Flavobacterium cerinum TaxID=2502784 RepID=A0ABY5IMV9_9FLAO|nr:RagB/SusD family nutrient uptake outer membrane protein [Flavobacterium cerinum]UUC44183.1 RagB/SusD family nutrient uptake outer membrane protein [Flavobacterium cerinum]
MKKILFLITLGFVFSCGKKLELKPNSSLVIPRTVSDFENLLDNPAVMNLSPALAQVSADEYIIPTLADYQSIVETPTRTAYIWAKDIYQGETQTADWKRPYAQIYYCNSILDELKNQNLEHVTEFKRIKGWAMFVRAYSYYELVSIFAKAYDASTANTDLGLPLKLNSAISQIVPRSTVQKNYNQIISDATEATNLLQTEVNLTKRNRPSKAAAHALLARVYLSMRKYIEAEAATDKALALFSTLKDYKTLQVVPTSSSFTINSDEVIYFSNVVDWTETSVSRGDFYSVLPSIVNSFEENDLRKTIWFTQNINGNWYIKGINNIYRYPFTGLATDELLLIKAECLARRNQSQDAMDQVNRLLITRWNSNATTPTKPYQSITATSPSDALDKVLSERKKSLLWRSVRWTDLRRLNLEGRNIVLTRNLNGTIYTLEPNSPRYVMPIPDDEIALSGIEQNIR